MNEKLNPLILERIESAETAPHIKAFLKDALQFEISKYNEYEMGLTPRYSSHYDTLLNKAVASCNEEG